MRISSAALAWPSYDGTSWLAADFTAPPICGHSQMGGAGLEQRAHRRQEVDRLLLHPGTWARHAKSHTKFLKDQQ